jgi:hypothetical protein
MREDHRPTMNMTARGYLSLASVFVVTVSGAEPLALTSLGNASLRYGQGQGLRVWADRKEIASAENGPLRLVTHFSSCTSRR